MNTIQTLNDKVIRAVNDTEKIVITETTTVTLKSEKKIFISDNIDKFDKRNVLPKTINSKIQHQQYNSIFNDYAYSWSPTSFQSVTSSSYNIPNKWKSHLDEKEQEKFPAYQRTFYDKHIPFQFNKQTVYRNKTENDQAKGMMLSESFLSIEHEEEQDFEDEKTITDTGRDLEDMMDEFYELPYFDNQQPKTSNKSNQAYQSNLDMNVRSRANNDEANINDMEEHVREKQNDQYIIEKKKGKRQATKSNSSPDKMKITEKVFDSQLESLKDSVEQSSQMKSLLIPLVNKQRYVVNHDEILAQDKSHCLQTDMSSQEVSYDDYLRSIIAEPLTHALVNVSQYRPEDSIEYISKFLRDWAETSHYNNVIHNETKLTLTNIEIHRENCLLNHKHQKHDKLFKLKAQENIRNAMQLEYDRNLYHNSQWVQLIDMKNDDEREPASIHQHFLVDLLHQQQTQQQFKQNKTAQHIHYHETSTNTANEQQIRDEVTSLKNERGCGDTITLATYFSNLKNKLINCDP